MDGKFFRAAALAALMSSLGAAAVPAKTFSEAADEAESVSEEKDGKEEKTDEGPKESRSASGPAASTSASDSSSSGDSAFLALLGILGDIWFFANGSARFLAYPYQDGRSYIVHEQTSFKSSTLGEIGETGTPARTRAKSRGRIFRVGLSTEAFRQGDLGWGNETLLDGHLVAVGPWLSNVLYRDGSGGISGCARLGGQLSLLSTNPLFVTFVGAWTGWYGEQATSATRSGISLGFDVRSWPFNPLALRFRVLWSYFKRDVATFDFSAGAGVMLGRFEPFAAFRYTSVYSKKTGDRSERWLGASAGIRLHL